MLTIKTSKRRIQDTYKENKFAELVHIFIKGPAAHNHRVRDFLAALWTRCVPSAIPTLWSGWFTFGIFSISPFDFNNEKILIHFWQSTQP